MLSISVGSAEGEAVVPRRFIVRARQDAPWIVAWSPVIALRPVVAMILCHRPVVLRVADREDVWRVAERLLEQGGGHIDSLQTEVRIAKVSHTLPLRAWAGTHGCAWSAQAIEELFV